jgi:hypothetical protein
MKPWLVAGVSAASLVLGATTALAVDNEAGVPLTPAEAAGGWTLEAAGHPVCMVKLTATRTAAAAYAASAPANCGEALPAGVAGWTPTADGMALTGADGHVLIAFDRWSNSLFVSHRSSGMDIQLQRGGPSD